MKVRDLIEALQGRDPSGEVVLTLSGDGFQYAANFDVTPPANRRVILEADPEDVGVNTEKQQDEIDELESKLEDAESDCQKLRDGINDELNALATWQSCSNVPADLQIALSIDKLEYLIGKRRKGKPCSATPILDTSNEKNTHR